MPFGTGTSLEGNVVGNENGITISLEKMNKILDVNVEDFDCRVQACVTKEQLNDYLREDGVFFLSILVPTRLSGGWPQHRLQEQWQ